MLDTAVTSMEHQTGQGFTLDPLVCHDVSVADRRILLHIPTSSLFDLDPLSIELLDLLKSGYESASPVAADTLRHHFEGRYAADSVFDVVQEFRNLGIIRGRDRRLPDPPQITRFPLSTIVLNITTGCNLACSYCYKEDLTTPAKSLDMELETAKQSVDLLIRESGDRSRVNIVFFGGEPLRRFEFIKAVVAYAEDVAAAAGKTADFSLTTNATLLTDDIIDYLDAHRFGLAVSMDGPKALHDKNRRTVGNKGSYDAVVRKVRDLLSRYRSRPVGARVTLTAGVTDVEAIHAHLRDELGFAEVGYAPVTAGDNALFNLSEDELLDVFSAFKRMGEQYVDAALQGRNTGFANLHQLMTDLHDGTKKTLPCGAGVGMLAVDKDGGLNLCHRFTGSTLEPFGNLDDGIDKPRLGAFLETRMKHEDTACTRCRIRNFCAGGCYHESYARYGDPQHPTYHYCNIMRDWIDFGINAYVRILAGNPAFFENHITPRHNGRDVIAPGPVV